jgi:hypothetical protein
MLTLERFESLADSYGGNLESWPAETRQDARALSSASAAAQAILARARALDDAVAAAADLERSRAWPDDEAAAALARLRSRVAVRIATYEPVRERRWLRRWAPAVSALLNSLQAGWAGLLAGGVLAVASGLAIGLLYTSGPPSADVLFLLEPNPLPIFSDSLR